MRTNFEMKKINTLKVFHTFQKNSELSRKEIENLTDLSWGTVFNICNELLQKQLIISQKESSTVGRPLEKLTINPIKKLFLGIDINSVGLSFDVVNLAGRSIYSRFEPIFEKNKNIVISYIISIVKQILDKYENIIFISISMQGKLDREKGISIRTNFFEEWKNVPLVKMFEEEFHIPTLLYHDPECLLTYHLNKDFRLNNAKNGFVIRVDDGIGMAQLVDGKLYEPDYDTAFELGHTVVVPNGNICSCGKKGCLEAYSSLRSMKLSFFNDKTIDNTKAFMILNENIDEADKIKEDAAFYLGVAISNLQTLFSPSFILLDGIVPNFLNGFYDNVEKYTKEFSNGECSLIKANYEKNAAAIGACLLTIYKQLEDILFEDEMCSV